MGFVRKIAGALTGANVQAEATQRAADTQAAAMRESADATAKAAKEAAAQTAVSQEQAVARMAAQDAAAKVMEKPLENADVRLAADTPLESTAGKARKRRAQFGVGGAPTGVQI